MAESGRQTKLHSRDRSQDSHEACRRTEMASYIGNLAGDLAVMVRKSGLETLGFLLEMARMEADNTVRHGGGGRKPTVRS